MSILEIILVLPILAALAIGLGAPRGLTAIGVTGANAILGGIVAFRFIQSGGEVRFETSRMILEEPELALAFGVDGLSLMLLLLTLAVSFAAVCASPDLTAPNEKSRLYYIAPLLIGAGAAGAFLSKDLFFFYAFHELALIPTFLAIGVLGHTSERVDTAWRITLYLGVGSLVLLAGLLMLFFQLGGTTFDIEAMRELAAAGALDDGAQKWTFLVLLIGFGILISLFPFHSWAPSAYATAPAPVAMLHAGVLKKFGVYGLLTVALPMLPAGLEAWRGLILVLLLGNVLVIGFITISQERLDRMLGYSSVMHMGFIFLGLVSFNEIGLHGAALLMLAHGLSIALLFALCGHLRRSVPSLNLHTMGGLGRQAPQFAFLFGLAAFASIGLPGFGNFASEILVFFGGFQGYAGEGMSFTMVATILCLWGVVISAVYMLRAFRRIFQGEEVQKHALRELPLRSAAPGWLLLVLLLVIGVVPFLILGLFGESLEFVAKK